MSFKLQSQEQILILGLGLDPTSLEKTIESYLRRAERWRAIVLIDEADIFMGKRNESITHEKEALVAGKKSTCYPMATRNF